MKKLLSVLLFGLLVGVVNAATYTWTGLAADGDLDNTNNFAIAGSGSTTSVLADVEGMAYSQNGGNDTAIGTFNGVTPVDAFTISCWHYVDAASLAYLFRFTDGASVIGLQDDGANYTMYPGNYADVLAGPAVLVGEWVHIIYRANYITGEQQFWTNGVIAATNALTTAMGITTATAIEFGYYDGGGWAAPDGQIDEFCMWTNYMSDAVCTNLYDEGRGNYGDAGVYPWNSPSLVLWYHFNSNYIDSCASASDLITINGGTLVTNSVALCAGGIPVVTRNGGIPEALPGAGDVLIIDTTGMGPMPTKGTCDAGSTYLSPVSMADTLEGGTFNGDYFQNNGIVQGTAVVASLLFEITAFGTVDGSGVSVSGAWVNDGVIGGVATPVFTASGTNNTVGEINDGVFTSVDNWGVIDGGAFSLDCINESSGSITAGSFGNALFNNYGAISGGTFSPTLFRNESGGTLSGGTINGGDFSNYGDVNAGTTVDTGFGNEGGTINGGTFNFAGANKTAGTVWGGTFNATFENQPTCIVRDGTFVDFVNQAGAFVYDGAFGFLAAGTINYGTIYGGTFTGTTWNDLTAGVIEGGTFTGVGGFNNYGTINGGNFDTLTFVNEGTISSGTNSCEIDQSVAGTISGGYFSGSIDNASGTSISGGIFDGAINTVDAGATISGGTFNNTLTDANGTLSGGIFNSTIDLDAGELSGGNYFGDITMADGLAGFISGGSYSGLVTSVTTATSNPKITGGTFWNTVTMAYTDIINGPGAVFRGPLVLTAAYFTDGTTYSNITMTASAWIQGGTHYGTIDMMGADSSEITGGATYGTLLIAIDPLQICIDGGTHYGTVDDANGIINAGTFSGYLNLSGGATVVLPGCTFSDLKGSVLSGSGSMRTFSAWNFKGGINGSSLLGMP